MGTGAAILGGAALTAGASLWGASEASKAAGRAAEAQVAGADRATAAQLEMYYQGREDLAPWREAGQNALARYAGLVADPSQFDPTKEPGYQFGYEEFIKRPYEQGAAAGGKRLSGETLRDLTRYASDYGSTQFDRSLNRLAPLLNIGQASAAGQANLAQTTGAQLGQNALFAGQAQAGGMIGQANAFSQGLAGVAGAGSNALQNYMDFKILEKIGGGNISLPVGQAGARYEPSTYVPPPTTPYGGSSGGGINKLQFSSQYV